MARRQPSEAGHTLVKQYERLKLFTYDDKTGRRLAVGEQAKGVPTIGWGNTRHALPVREISRVDAEAYYAEDATDAVATIARHVPERVVGTMPQECYDALFSLVFNTGDQLFGTKTKRTQFWRTLTTNFNEVPTQMRRWVYDNGVKVQGLVNRREAEAALWLKGLEIDLPPHDIEPHAAHESRTVPQPPKPVISEGPLLARPSTGAATTAAGTAGAVVTETAQQMNFMQQHAGHIVQLICLVLVLLGAGLTIYAVVKHHKEGQA